MQLKRFQRRLYTPSLLVHLTQNGPLVRIFSFLSFFLFSFMMGNPQELYIEAEDTDDDHRTRGLDIQFTTCNSTAALTKGCSVLLEESPFRSAWDVVYPFPPHLQNWRLRQAAVGECEAARSMEVNSLKTNVTWR